MTLAQRNVVLKRLEDAHLLTVNREKSGALISLDAHPLLREYFAKELRKNKAAWEAAHNRLFEHLCRTTPDKENPTLDNLQPLYQAVAHGCRAGQYEEERATRFFLSASGVGIQPIARKTMPLGLGPRRRRLLFRVAMDTRLGQARPNRPSLAPERGRFLPLRALGRLTEALEPMRAALRDGRDEQEDWRNAAVSASNLSALELTLGDVAKSVKDGETSMTYGDRSNDTRESAC